MNSRLIPPLLLLLSLLLLRGCSGRHDLLQRPAGVAEEEPEPEAITYLFPILRYGPNNQKRDLRQMIAIAKQLDCGLVLTGLYKHYRDTREPSAEADKKAKTKGKFDSRTAAATGALRTMRAPRAVKGARLPTSPTSPSSSSTTTTAAAAKAASSRASGITSASTSVAAAAAAAAAAGGKGKASQQQQGQEGLQDGLKGGSKDGRLVGSRERPGRGGGALVGSAAEGDAAAVASLSGTVAENQSRLLRAAAVNVASRGGGGSSSSVVQRAVAQRVVRAPTAVGAGALGAKGGKEQQVMKCFAYQYQHFLDADNVLDRAPISEYVPSASVSELKAMGWDGVIDAFMFREGHGPDDNSNNEWHLTKTLRSTGTNIASNFVRLPVKVPVNCDNDVIAGLRQKVQRFRVVALLLFTLGESEFPDYPKIMGPPPQEQCMRSLWQAERMLRPAPWIQQLATQYVNETFGGSDFLAVHVRPFPDECMDTWKAPRLEEGALKATCSGNTQGLHHVLAPKIRGQLDARPGIRHVFIMAHPGIRHNIQAVLEKEQVQARVSYLDEHMLTRLAGCVDHSATFMSMAEEEVAVQASAFLGTAGSSITHSIVAERMGVGHANISFIDL